MEIGNDKIVSWIQKNGLSLNSNKYFLINRSILFVNNLLNSASINMYFLGNKREY